jgi:hypothetical protein
MKKHKSHARHVFNFLEKNYGISIIFADDEEKKGGRKSINDRRSTGAVSKSSTKTNDLVDS